MKAIKDFTLAHCVASFALAWGEGIEIEYQKAVKNDLPFVTHCSEGFDDETVRDIQTLDKKGALGEHAVLVHGLAFSEKDMDLIKKKNANTVWCCDSNMFMYNDTTDIRMQLKKGINVSIGTDSPMSGGENLLYEMKFDKMIYKRFYNEDLPDKTILKMVTVNPAKAFRLKKNGYVKKGYLADLVIFNDREKRPESSVVSAELRDVKLVVINGSPAYGDAEYRYLFERLDVEYQNVRVDGVDKLIIGDLVGLLQRISRAVGFKKEFPFLPVDFKV
jgi:cytosine/adenosine deaminase-related metal-dependent hydrolase